MKQVVKRLEIQSYDFGKKSEDLASLFLEQEGNTSIYNLVHGTRSALLIENASVGWILNKDKIDRGEVVPTLLDDVRKEIEEIK